VSNSSEDSEVGNTTSTAGTDPSGLRPKHRLPSFRALRISAVASTVLVSSTTEMSRRSVAPEGAGPDASTAMCVPQPRDHPLRSREPTVVNGTSSAI
jgi:hypothetical protein